MDNISFFIFTTCIVFSLFYNFVGCKSFLNHSPGILSLFKQTTLQLTLKFPSFRSYLSLILKDFLTGMYERVIYAKDVLPLACNSPLKNQINSY